MTVENKSITMGVLGKKKRSRCDPAVKRGPAYEYHTAYASTTHNYESVPSVL